MTNDSVLALIEKLKEEANKLENFLLSGAIGLHKSCFAILAHSIRKGIKELESILPQRDRERDAATRIAALEEQSDLDWLERVKTQVRLEEAEGWAKKFGFTEGICDIEDCWPCDRIAELRKLAQPGEREREILGSDSF